MGLFSSYRLGSIIPRLADIRVLCDSLTTA